MSTRISAWPTLALTVALVAFACSPEPQTTDDTGVHQSRDSGSDTAPRDIDSPPDGNSADTDLDTSPPVDTVDADDTTLDDTSDATDANPVDARDTDLAGDTRPSDAADGQLDTADADPSDGGDTRIHGWRDVDHPRQDTREGPEDTGFSCPPPEPFHGVCGSPIMCCKNEALDLACQYGSGCVLPEVFSDDPEWSCQAC